MNAAIERPFWKRRIESVWDSGIPIVWLSGPPDVGKHDMIRCLSIGYRHAFLIWENEEKFAGLEVRREGVAVEHIRRRPDFPVLLKKAVESAPKGRILVVDDYPLGECRTLEGLVRDVRMTPILYEELSIFRISLKNRLHFGGLRLGVEDRKLPAYFIDNWISKLVIGIQAAFKFRRIDKIYDFFKDLALLNGDCIEPTALAQIRGISVPVARDFLRALESFGAIKLLPPLSSGHSDEIRKNQRVYVGDLLLLDMAQVVDGERADLFERWANLVLEQLSAYFPSDPVCYWRTKAGLEIPFVLSRPGGVYHVILTNQRTDDWGRALNVFRARFPRGENLIVMSNAPEKTRVARIEGESGLPVRWCEPSDLQALLSVRQGPAAK